MTEGEWGSPRRKTLAVPVAIFSPHLSIMHLQPPSHSPACRAVPQDVPWPPPAPYIPIGTITSLQSLLLWVPSFSSWLSGSPISPPPSPSLSTSHQLPSMVTSTRKGPQRCSSLSSPSPRSSSCSFIYCSEHHDIPCGHHCGLATPSHSPCSLFREC